MTIKHTIAALCLVTAGGISQGTAQVRYEKSVLNTNLFKEYVSGTVLMKNGKVEPGTLNYDTEHQSILFKSGEQVLTLTGLESVDTVFIDGRKFVPVEEVFYEVLSADTPVSLFVTYSNKKTQLVSSPDQTGMSKKEISQANNNVASAYLSRPNQLNYNVNVLPHYWLRRGKSMYKASNEKQVAKVFPLKNAEPINVFIKENGIDFKNPEDVIKLVAYCNKQPK